MSYDSSRDTEDHIDRVREYMSAFYNNLRNRAIAHDQSKLESPEKEIFDIVTPKLKGLTYGSDEYKAALGEMGEALTHHYEKILIIRSITLMALTAWICSIW